MSNNHLLSCFNALRTCALVVAFAFAVAIMPLPAFATTSGIDTPTGVTSLPLAVEGVEGMNLVAQSASGPVYVGIGITSPTTPLQIRSAANEDLVFRGAVSASSGAEIGAVNDVNSVWEPLQLDGSITILGMAGNVGVGLINPSYKLDVSGWMHTSSGIVFPDGTQQTTAATSGGMEIGGFYLLGQGVWPGCTGNPKTGGCSCPGGFNTWQAYAGASNGTNYYLGICWK